MPEAFAGDPGAGSALIYTVPADHALRLELLSFTLTTDGTVGVHAPEVQFYDAALAAITARLWDWNEGGPAMTLYYTFGIGLRPFNCTVTSGMMIPCHLPDTILQPNSEITVRATNAAGVTISGDTITAVVLYGELIDILGGEPGPSVALVGGYLPSDSGD